MTDSDRSASILKLWTKTQSKGENVIKDALMHLKQNTAPFSNNSIKMVYLCQEKGTLYCKIQRAFFFFPAFKPEMLGGDKLGKHLGKHAPKKFACFDYELSKRFVVYKLREKRRANSSCPERSRKWQELE